MIHLEQPQAAWHRASGGVGDHGGDEDIGDHEELDDLEEDVGDYDEDVAEEDEWVDDQDN